MSKELICENCGCKEYEIYEYEGKKVCFDCLEYISDLEVQTTTTYYANGEFFDENEFYEMIEYLGCKVIK